MAKVEIEWHLEASPQAVRDVVADVESFMLAAGFDEVRVEEERLHLEMVLGIARMDLTLKFIDNHPSVLAYEQIDGIFESMMTYYEVEAEDSGSLIRGVTEFQLGGVVGSILDATIIKRQRTREFESQFEWLEQQVTNE